MKKLGKSQVKHLQNVKRRIKQHTHTHPKTIVLKASHKDRAILRRDVEKSQEDCMIELGLGLSGSKCTERDKRKQKQWQ